MIHPILANTLKELETIAGSFYVVAPERHIRRGSADSIPRWEWESYDPKEETALSYSQLETGNRHIGYGPHSPLELVKLISERRLWAISTVVFCPDYFSSGDYGGSLVELSNLQSFLEDHQGENGIWELYGGHGSSGLALDVRAITPEILEDLGSLQDYPLRDDDHLSHLEIDKETEAWESYIKSDFRRALERKIEDLLESGGYSPAQLELADLAIAEIPESELYSILSDLAESANIYWETEAISRWIDIDRAISELTLQDSLELIEPYLPAMLEAPELQLELTV